MILIIMMILMMLLMMMMMMMMMNTEQLEASEDYLKDLIEIIANQ